MAKWASAGAIAAAMTLLAGCGSVQGVQGWDYRDGPNVVLSPDAAAASAQNQAQLFQALAKAQTNFDGTKPTAYQVTLAGFNFIDEECDLYLHELFALDHERDRLRKGVDSTGLLVNAILGAIPVSAVSMAVVTQAFGLTSAYVDYVANSYLYNTHSSAVQHIVNTLQTKYRADTKTNSSDINSEATAYHAIRGYLELCLPPTIEGNIDQSLLASTATSNGDASTVRLAAPQPAASNPSQ